MGRVYLPAAWLREAGVDPADVLRRARRPSTPALGAVVLRLLDAADEHYRRAELGVPGLPADCRPAIRAAGSIYADIGRVIRRRGGNSIDSRAHTSALRKALAAPLRAVGVGRDRRRRRAAPRAGDPVPARLGFDLARTVARAGHRARVVIAHARDVVRACGGDELLDRLDRLDALQAGRAQAAPERPTAPEAAHRPEWDVVLAGRRPLSADGAAARRPGRPRGGVRRRTHRGGPPRVELRRRRARALVGDGPAGPRRPSRAWSSTATDTVSAGGPGGAPTR
jgi:hypothetical protein